MTPIIFIHGFGGGSYEFQPIIRFLKKKGFKDFYEFTYRERFGEISLREIAKRLSDFTEKLKEKKFALIGISQGGVIARIFIKNNRRKLVTKCITLCTPHKGSLMGYLSKKPGFIELRPRSKLLEELNNYKGTTNYYCVYTPFDLMVSPGWNARFEDARQNKRVLQLLHPLAFWCKSTLNFIDQSLRE